MIIKNDGKIGVNTLNPAELFDVSGVLQTIDFKVGSITSNTTSDIILKKSITGPLKYNARVPVIPKTIIILNNWKLDSIENLDFSFLIIIKVINYLIC